ncbi:hypothetical protein SDC9_84613 [bioreactor metagenome]|uniref:Uncharacterized protein n=1 Tax=bioreactor metagenome TaxID=1076179 RepID=A0A644ZAS6_9ZZZZ
MVFQRLLILGESEEIALFLCLFYLTSAVGALAVDELMLCPEGLAWGAVPTLVLALVYISLVVHHFKHFLYGLHVVIVGGADEKVIGNTHDLPQFFNAGNNIVNILFGSFAGCDGLALNFLTVLVGAGQEHDVVALKPFKAGHGVGGNGAVGVADVEIVRRVINRR